MEYALASLTPWIDDIVQILLQLLKQKVCRWSAQVQVHLGGEYPLIAFFY